MRVKLYVHIFLGVVLGVLLTVNLSPVFSDAYRKITGKGYDFSSFEVVIKRVQEEYVAEDVDIDVFMDTAINAGLQSLDKYSLYFPPEKMAKAVSIINGTPAQTGIGVADQDDLVTVDRVFNSKRFSFSELNTCSLDG